MMNRKHIEDLLRNVRVMRRIEEEGITLKYAKKERLSNVRWGYRNGGRSLEDATIHTSYRWEIRGQKTYNLRETLKGFGFRWDPTEKVWHAKKVETLDLGCALLRELAR